MAPATGTYKFIKMAKILQGKKHSFLLVQSSKWDVSWKDSPLISLSITAKQHILQHHSLPQEASSLPHGAKEQAEKIQSMLLKRKHSLLPNNNPQPLF